MKTRYFIFVALAMAGMAVSCSKSDVGGEAPLPEEEAPVPIQLTTNLKVNSVSVTKAGVDKWNGQKLYIYALPTNKIPASGSTEILVENAPADAPNDNPDDAPNAKKDITLYDNEEAGTFYYYPADKSTFDFYGYYVGDAYIDPTLTEENVPTKPNPTIASDNISLKLYLDGSQDIMLAKADKIADTEGKEIAPANAYSAYSARKNIKPNLVFQHQLSRFVFNVVAGTPNGKDVEIKSLTLTSKNQADLVIASLDGVTGITGFEDKETATFRLKEVDGTDLQPWFPENQVAEGVSYEMTSDDRIGESIMVIPDAGKKHIMVMTMQQMNEGHTTELGDEFTYKYDLTPDIVVPAAKEFLPGYQYNVNVVVYGREQVEISVTLTEWATGGTITIDNDKEWGDEPKLGYKATKDNVVYHLYFYTNPIAPGTEVKVWDPVANAMVSADEGTYMFGENQGTEDAPIWYVKLVKQEGETPKTVVEGLYDEDPTPTPGEEETPETPGEEETPETPDEEETPAGE